MPTVTPAVIPALLPAERLKHDNDDAVEASLTSDRVRTIAMVASCFEASGGFEFARPSQGTMLTLILSGTSILHLRSRDRSLLSDHLKR